MIDRNNVDRLRDRKMQMGTKINRDRERHVCLPEDGIQHAGVKVSTAVNATVLLHKLVRPNLKDQFINEVIQYQRRRVCSSVCRKL